MSCTLLLPVVVGVMLVSAFATTMRVLLVCVNTCVGCVSSVLRPKRAVVVVGMLYMFARSGVQKSRSSPSHQDLFTVGSNADSFVLTTEPCTHHGGGCH